MRAFSLARHLLHKVGGTLLTNCIPATPIDAFVGEVMAPTLADAKKPGRSTTDNRGLARSVPAWTSAELADGACAGQVAFVNG